MRNDELRKLSLIHHSAFIIFFAYAAFATLPALMQEVQTFMRTVPPCGRWTRMDCRLGSKRRGVRLFACETLLPNCGPLPQTSHRLAMTDSVTSENLKARPHSQRFCVRGKQVL